MWYVSPTRRRPLRSGCLRSAPAISTVMNTTVISHGGREWQRPRPDGPLYSVYGDIDATIYRYGLKNEEPAKKAIKTRLKKTISLSGLFIHRTLNYLAASPDGLIGEDSILEVTCPSSIKEYTPKKAFNLGKLSYMKVGNKRGELVLKRNYVFYYQVQGQLNISEKKYCYFVVWTPKGFIIDKIHRDESFFNEKIEPFVTEFYMKSLLPEIIDPRFKRNLPIRTGISNEAV